MTCRVLGERSSKRRRQRNVARLSYTVMGWQAVRNWVFWMSRNRCLGRDYIGKGLEKRLGIINLVVEGTTTTRSTSPSRSLAGASCGFKGSSRKLEGAGAPRCSQSRQRHQTNEGSTRRHRWCANEMAALGREPIEWGEDQPDMNMTGDPSMIFAGTEV